MRAPEPHTGGTRGERTRPESNVVDVDQSFDGAGLYALRATLAAHASSLGATDGAIERLVIVAGELATNSILHGGGSGRMRLWHDDTTLYLQITDQGPGIADHAVGTVAPTPTSTGGRGLWICRNLAQELIIESDHRGRGASVTAIFTSAMSPEPPLALPS
jgi:anti-sigma regulatory factor (Ser/Thr protein kinase)